MSEPSREDITNAHIQGLYDRVERQEKALRTLVWWLVQAQTGFGQHDARGIEDILDSEASR
jgi:hypothetical protein